MRVLPIQERDYLIVWCKDSNAKNPQRQRALWRLRGRTNEIMPKNRVAFWIDVTRGRFTE